MVEHNLIDIHNKHFWKEPQHFLLIKLNKILINNVVVLSKSVFHFYNNCIEPPFNNTIIVM